MNNAIIPAVFTGIATDSGELPGPDGRLVIGAGETVLDITLENSRNTEYELKVLGKDAGLVTAHEFVGLLRIRLTLVCPEDGEDRNLDISLHLSPPPGRAQPADYPLPLKYALGKIQFLYIIPNAPSGPLTKLTLLFAGNVPVLATDDISVTVDDVNRGPPKWVDIIPGETDAIYEIYEISINEITQAQSITVEIALAGYGRVSKSVDVDVNADAGNTPPDDAPEKIQFLGAMPYDSYGTTEKITLVFDQDLPGLSADDIRITGQGGSYAAVTKGELKPIIAGVYELTVDVAKSETIYITVTNSAYTVVSESPRSVKVRYAVPARSVTVSDEIENGTLVPSPLKAAKGDEVKVYLYPDTGYVYEEKSLGLVDYDGEDPGFQPQSDGTYTFEMPDEAVVLTARFFQPEARLALASGGDIQYFKTLKEAFDKAGTGDATITVLRNTSVKSGIDVTGTVTLVAADGKEKTVKRGNSAGSLFTVSGAGTSLTLDAGNSLGLALDGGKGSNITATAALVKVVSGGKLAMGNGVTLKNNNNTDGNGGCGGVYVDGNCVFTMNGGKISGNKVSGNGDGGGVYVTGNSTFTMSGGEISGNAATSEGGGLYLSTSSTFEMAGDAVISGNTAPEGGGVYLYGGTFNMKSGVISGNTVSGSNADGGGVYVSSNTSFTMEGGAISGNTATNGNGVYAGGTFTMSGTAVVKQDVYLASGRKITVSDALTAAAAKSTSIKLASASNGDAVLEGASGYSLTESDIAKFTLNDASAILFPDLPQSKVRYAKPAGTPSAAAPVLYINNDTPSYGTLTAAISAATGTTAAAPAVISIANTMTLSSSGDNITLGPDKHIKLTVTDGGDKAIERGSNSNTGSLFTVNAGASLTLDAGNGSLTLDGKDIAVAAPLVNVSGGTLTMGNGVTLTNNNNSNSDGGGVMLNNSGSFVMKGGTISGNTAGSGGGVLLNNGGTFTMSGGTISGNEANGYAGGGVLINDSGTFTMNSGTISGNTAKNFGGGVHIGGAFTMNDGTISDNHVTAGSGVYGRGGGVYQDSGTFQMTGGTIYGSSAGGLSNTAANNGAAYARGAGVTNSANYPSGLSSSVEGTIVNGAATQ